MLSQDLRYAGRTLVRNPGFSSVAVLCLAIGIGVNSTIFSVVNGVLIKPFPYEDPDRIVVLDSTNQRLGVTEGGISYADYKDLRDQTITLQAVAAFGSRSLTLSDGASEPERYLGSTISWNLFPLLGIHPVLGRHFTPEDDRPGAEPVVLLSYEVWQRRYNADGSVVGRAVSVNSRPHTIVGVMPPRFAFPEMSRLWVPHAPYGEKTARDVRSLQLFGRLKPDVTQERTASDVGGIGARLASMYPKENRDWSVEVRSLAEWMLPGDVKLILFTMMGAVTLVLMIACANVANLLLARASVRHREMSIRAALGAGRWRIVRQLLTEAVLLGLLSAPLGVGIAFIGLKLLDRGIPPDTIPYFIHWTMDGQSLLYTIAVSMVTGVVFGLAPAMQAASGNLQESLKEGARGATTGRRAWMRNGLVVAEVSLALVLLVGASLFVRSFLNFQDAKVGFDTAPLMAMRFYLPGEAYEPPDAKSRRVDDIVRRIEGLPGVQAAFASNFVPFAGGGGGGEVVIEGRPTNDPAMKEPSISQIATTPHFRQTLGVALVRGRDFTETEGAMKSGVALINEAMAQRFWKDTDPIGRRFRLSGDGTPDWFTVIGVVADFHHFQWRDTNRVHPASYVPYPYEPTLNTGLTIRVAGDPPRITSAAREQIRLSDPALPVFQVRTVEEGRQRSFWEYTLFGWMFSIFGFIALALASIGVYGVLSYAVSQRTQEIGVRVALGAARGDVLRLIVGQGLRLAGLGIVIGVLGAAGITPLIRSILHNVTPTDPLSFSTVAVFLTIVAFVASYIPARRALRVDPIVALRGE